ncbi:MAG: SH3 domain-containing protein [Alphaproteobacteria bacterium]|nr:SH3 domain-containing protein [Alphaproteobacteria bacterium]
MNGLLNVGLSVALGIFILGSAYFIKMDSKSKPISQIPEFVSTKFTQTNLRTGPSLDYPIIYTYNQKQIPLKVIDIHEDWFQIKDIYGQQGWVYKNLVNSQKYGIVLGQSNVYLTSSQKKILAIIGEGNIIKIINCESRLNLCKIEFSTAEYSSTPFIGWINKSNLWGNTED